ncbi:unnamed protein product [Agarophyton chilense]
MGATLSALIHRLEQQTAFFDSKPDILAWQVREAIRTEFFKIVYPTPPTSELCALVQNCEQLLQRYHLPHRPFFFPGGRVAVPTEAGSRRAATSLQLRFKMASGITVTEAMLHLDGPDGGAFQWVQTHALTPLAPLLAAVMAPSPQQPPPPRPKRRRATAQKRPRQSRPRARRASHPTHGASPPPNASGVMLPQRPPLPQMHRGTSFSAPSPPSTPMRSSPQLVVNAQQSYVPAGAHSSTPPQTPQPTPARVSNVVARLARQEISGVFVPKELLTFAPPPRARLCTSLLSNASGSLQRAFDVGSADVLASLYRVKNLVLVKRLLARKFEGDNVLYYVVWGGGGVKNGSWEKREALMKDVPAMVRQFDVKHPMLPEKVNLHGERRPAGWHSGLDGRVNSNRASCQQSQVGGSEAMSGARGLGGTGGGGAASDSAVGIDGTMSGGGEIEHRVSTTTSVGRASSTTEVASSGGHGGGGVSGTKQIRHYVDDLTGEEIPSWVDTPIVELNICGMILQIRRPDEAVLHNDATSAVRDTKKRQTRFKQENIVVGERLFPLSKSEAKAAVEASVRVHRQYNRLPILFPRGIGRVSAGDHGAAFSVEDAQRAPACWEGYLSSVGLRCVDFERELAPHMPSAEEWVRARVARTRVGVTHNAAAAAPLLCPRDLLAMNACRTSTLVRSLPPGLSSALLAQSTLSALPSHVPRRRRHHHHTCSFVAAPPLSCVSFKRSHSCMLCTATSSPSASSSSPVTPATPTVAAAAEPPRRQNRATLDKRALAAAALAGGLATAGGVVGVSNSGDDNDEKENTNIQCSGDDGTALSSSTVTSDDSTQQHDGGCTSVTARARSLVFRSAVVSIPHPDKADKGGEDAFFVQCNALGVFDGVGGWASIGVDAGLYSKQLAQLTGEHIYKQGACSVKEALKQAAACNEAIGSSTACVVGIDDGKLFGVNLGDSGLVVIRDGRIIYKTVEQQHYFNCPYQIGTDSLDTVEVGNSIEVGLRHGDWVIMGTDGLWDNVFADKIVEVVAQHEHAVHNTGAHEEDDAAHKSEEQQNDMRWEEASVVSDCGSNSDERCVARANDCSKRAEIVAEKLGEVAVKVANNERSSSPFAVNARNAGHVFMGGKVDDITIISALVVDGARSDDLTRSDHHPPPP